MDPESILLIIQAIQAAIAAAPQIEQVAIDAKNWVASLFSNSLISKETQDLIHAHVDAYQEALLNGTTPPEFTVEADPS